MLPNAAELKQMIMSFRMSELQSLLSFAGKDKVGRKSELLQRSLILLKNTHPQIQLKIQELYKNQVKEQALQKSIRAHSLPESSKETSSSERIVEKDSHSSTPSTTMDNMGYSSSRMSSSRSSSRSSGRTTESGYAHSSSRTTSSSSSSSSSSRSTHPTPAQPVATSSYVCDQKMYDSLKTGLLSTIPSHPNVKFKRLPFYDHMGELLKPTTLMPRGPPRTIEDKGVKKQISEAYYIFNLTALQAQDIAMSRDLRPGAKIEYTVQVQMRFCLLDCTKEQDDNFPGSICVRVNGKMAPLPNPIPSNRPGVEPKRPSRPVAITSLCRLSPTVPNRIDVSWAGESGKAHCIKVDLVKRVTSEILMSRLRTKGARHPDHTRTMIRQKMASDDPDNDIALDTLKVSIQCPLSKMRIQVPCRPQTCSHVQIFDAMIFLQMNERKATWVCPVCDKDAHFDVLSLDGYFTEVVNSAAPDVTDINLSEDGSWEPVKQGSKKESSRNSEREGGGSTSSKTSSNRSSPAATTNHVTAPTTTTTSTSENGTNGSQLTNGTEGGTKRKVVAVDLTLSDSDDDDNASKPPPAKRPATATNHASSSSSSQERHVASGVSSAATNHHSSSSSSSSGSTNNNNSSNSVPSNSHAQMSRSHPYPVSGPTPVALTANQTVPHAYMPGMPIGYGYNAPSTAASISSSSSLATSGYPTTPIAGYGGMPTQAPPHSLDLSSYNQNLMLDYLARNGNASSELSSTTTSSSQRGPRTSATNSPPTDVVTLD